MRAKYFILAFITFMLPQVGLSAGEEEKLDKGESGSYSRIEKVVLFNTGVGYFERSVVIKNDTPLKLTFKSNEINDVLKSLVFYDVKGGKIERIDYPSKLPLSKMLESFSINISKNEKLSSLLNQLKGETIEIQAEKSYRGMIVSVETRKKDGNSIPYLNLFTSDGIISKSLDSIKKISFLNPEIESQLKEVLKLIAKERNRDIKEIILHFSGSEKGEFKLAYILPSPIWKMSYRLVILDDNKSLLQGWAIVENTTEDNWNNISLSLVSGNPISYIMELYTPIFVKRPEVEVPLPPNIKPQVYGGVIEEKEKYKEYGIAPSEISEEEMQITPTIEAPMMKKTPFVERKMDITGAIELKTAGELKGNFFSYTVEYPITIPIHKSAMIPIINAKITGKNVVVYNENVLEEHPLNGYEIENTTGMYIAGGPISVFKDGIFAGDAQIETLAPKEKRLITFSADLDTEIVSLHKSFPQLIESLKIVHGVLESKIKLQRSVIYKINNRGMSTKNLLIEQRSDPDWKLVKPSKPYEVTRNMYRFLLKVGGVQTKQHALTYEVVEEKVIAKRIALIGLDTSDLNFYLKSGKISENVRRALEKIAGLKTELAKIEKDYQKLEERYSTLSKDQERITNNMRTLNKNSNLYRRYVAILEKQENEIQKILEEKKKLSELIAEKKKEIEDYLNSLNVE